MNSSIPGKTGKSVFGNASGMAVRMAAFDWERSPVGPVDAWPAALKTTVRLLLDCRLPMYLAWGKEFTQFYNDAYVPILGIKDGNALARMLRSRPETAGMTLIALTGYGQEPDRQRALQAGFDRFFVKPVDAADVLAAIRAAPRRAAG